jgi:6-phosphogluconolactonase
LVFPILADGTLGGHTAALKNAGAKGPNKERQEGPHAHWVQPSPDNRFVFVSDLGLDAILSYRLDAAKGTLTSNDPFTNLAPGAGPRHAAFSPDGKLFYVVSELTSTVTAFSYDATKGTFRELQTLSTLPIGFHGRNDAAEIALHPNGKFLYASNRGSDTIAVFNVQPSGRLGLAANVPTGGKEPRHFAIDPSGNFLLAENQLSDRIVVFRIDQKTGALTPTGDSAEVPSPVCIAFLAVE